jgi:nucleolar GTP-binding protein
MFKEIPQVLTDEQLIEDSFKKTKKIKITDRNPEYRLKKTIIKKTDVFCNNITTKLEDYVKKFPSIDNLPNFYQKIIDIKIDVNKLKKALGAVDWARKTCKNIYQKQHKSLNKRSKINFLEMKQKEIYGRISSVVKQVNKELTLLSEAQKIIKKLPSIYDLPTIVIAGYPNVGKSSLLKCLSSAKPEIAQYPFTTKEIYVGHLKRKIKYEKQVFQIIDTPGLLDRPISERNKIEQQAIAALAHLADIILFVVDPSETSGYLLENQKSLQKQLEKMFKNSIFITVENKVDIKKTRSKNLKVSCKNGKNIDVLTDEVFKHYINFKKDK